MSNNRNRYSTSPMYGHNTFKPAPRQRTDAAPQARETAAQAQPEQAFSTQVQQQTQPNYTPYNGQMANPAGMNYNSVNPTGYQQNVYQQPGYYTQPQQTYQQASVEPGYQQQAFLQEQARLQQQEERMRYQMQQNAAAQQPQAAFSQGYNNPGPAPAATQHVAPLPQRESGHDNESQGPLWLLIVFTVGLPLLFVISFILFFAFKWIVPCLLSAVVIGGFVSVMWVLRSFSAQARKTLTTVYCALALVLIGAMGVSLVADGCTGTAPEKTIIVSQETAQASIIQVTPSPSPTANTSTSYAQRQLEMFMSYWANKQYESCVALCRPDWVNQQSDAKVTLFHKLGDITPMVFTIEKTDGSEADSSRTITMLVQAVNYNKTEVYYRYTVLMLKVNNTWYIDPDSLSGYVVSNDELIAEGKTITTPTPSPTPVPTINPDMTLYYNPNGGSYYHVDKQCSSMDSKAKKALKSFTFRELNNDTYKALNPCTKCGAPMRTSLTAQ